MIDTRKKSDSPAIVWVAFIVLLFWTLASSAYHGAINPNSGVTGGDFKFFMSAADRLNHGQPLYQYEETGATYVYSPLLALVLRPIAALGRERALAAWAMVNVVCLTASILIFSHAARLTLRDAAVIGLFAIIGFRCWPSVMTFGLGQANLLLLLSLACLYWADAADRPYLAALAIAGGALIKTWMIGLVIYLIIRRQYRAACAIGLFFVGFLVVLFAAVGFREVGLFYDLTAAYAGQKMGLMVISQSIPGFASLHFTANQHVQPLVDAPLLKTVFVLSSYVAIAAMLLRLFFLPPAATPLEKRLRLGFVTLCMLMTLPYCAQEYYVLALPILWTMLTPRSGGSRGQSVVMAACSLLIYFCLTRPTPNKPLAAEYTQGLGAMFVSAPFFVGLLLLGMCAGVLLWINWPARVRKGRTEPQIAPIPASTVGTTYA